MDERVRRTVDTYESIADEYETIHGDRSEIADLVGQFLEAVERDDGGPDAPRVLDVGPGPGWESATFADHGFAVDAVDVTRSFLEQTRDRTPAVDVVRGDMRALPYARDSFDGLWACASLLHVPREDVPATLAEFERVLASGGVVLVSIKRSDGGGGDESEAADEPGGDLDLSGSPYDDDRRHFETYRPDRVRELFESAGFVDVSIDPDGGWIAIEARAE